MPCQHGVDTGYISQEGISRINKLLKRAKRYGFTDTLHTFSELLEEADCHPPKCSFYRTAWNADAV